MLSEILVVYGPYVNSTGGGKGRKTVQIRYKSGKRRTVSYPKFLVEFILNRELDPKIETVDHINGDFNNNSWSNLRIVPISMHVSQDNKRARLIEMTCVLCGKKFMQAARVTRYRKSKAGPFCGMRCVGIYSRGRQLNKVAALPPQMPISTQLEKQPKVDGILVSSLPLAATTSENDILAFILNTQILRSSLKQAVRSNREQKVKAHRAKRHQLKQRGTCAVCGRLLTTRNSDHYCSSKCAHFATRRVLRPTADELYTLVWTAPTSAVAKQLGVSDKAVEKWCKIYNIDKPPRGYWAKKKAEH